jgi:hypothetical protein
MTIRVVNAPTLTWVAPEPNGCAERPQARLIVTADSPRPLRSVTFFDGDRRVATVRDTRGGLYGATWNTRRAAAGRHVLRAVVRDAAGRTAAASRPVRVCK